jgi:uncharacterized protein YmfQ (DUF2313 family)
MIDEHIRALNEAAIISKAALNNTDDWVTIKKIMLRSLHPDLRKSFSTRDPKTKEQWLNEFEKQLIIKYKEITGITLICRSLKERRELNGGKLSH